MHETIPSVHVYKTDDFVDKINTSSIVSLYQNVKLTLPSQLFAPNVFR